MGAQRRAVARAAQRAPYKNPAGRRPLIPCEWAIFEPWVSLYVRVSTDSQTVENQIRELSQVAERRGWQVVEVRWRRSLPGPAAPRHDHTNWQAALSGNGRIRRIRAQHDPAAGECRPRCDQGQDQARRALHDQRRYCAQAPWSTSCGADADRASSELAKGVGIGKVAHLTGLGTGTVHKLKREMAASMGA